MTEQQACTLCGAGGHLAAQCNWNKAEGAQVERALFEARFPVPEGIEWRNTDYFPVPTENVGIYVGLVGVAARYTAKWEAWQARAALAQPSPERGQVVVTKKDGIIVAVTRQDAEGRVLSVIAEAQPSPAPELDLKHPEAAEMLKVVRHEVNEAYNDRKMITEAIIEIMAQHDRIVRALREENAHLREERDSQQRVAIRAMEERDAALAKLAAMEQQEPVAWGAFNVGGKRDGKLYTHCDTEADVDAYILAIHQSSDSLTLRKAQLYAAQVAQAGQVPAIQVRKLGIHGKAYDLPETKRAYTYAEQPDNLGASRLGTAATAAFAATAGDHIDRGLLLLRELQAKGFGVFELSAAPAQGGE
ncbi:hypothetical protein [Pseudomonas nitroreducens]|uniref:hypothetical protein n=1 Tax=Pseudomonas nitroreducens TaxID=46680 RepID=UPI003CC82AE1